MRALSSLVILGLGAAAIAIAWKTSFETNAALESGQEQAADENSKESGRAFANPELLIRTPPPTLRQSSGRRSEQKEDGTKNDDQRDSSALSSLLINPTLTPTAQVSAIPSRLSDASLDALREVEAAGKSFADKIVPGLGAPAPRAAVVIASPTPIVTPIPTGLPLVGGQARGYAMLYLMHPRAQQTVERQLQILLEANIRDIYLGVLTDGTFGENLEYLASIIRRIGRSGRTLTLALYLTNGSSMRSFATTPISAGFNRIDPLIFRELIQEDFSTQQQFLSMVRKVAPLFDLNRRENKANRNVALVMLEDNLEVNSYRSMRFLAASVLPRTVQLIRNPCPGCFEGNDTEDLGDGLESHLPDELLSGVPMRGFSLDGVGYSLPGDSPSPALLPEQVEELLSAAVQRQLAYFALWRRERQGITTPLLHPDQRNYEVPSEQHKDVEIGLLRFGLSAVE